MHMGFLRFSEPEGVLVRLGAKIAPSGSHAVWHGFALRECFCFRRSLNAVPFGMIALRIKRLIVARENAANCLNALSACHGVSPPFSAALNSSNGIQCVIPSILVWSVSW